MKPKTIVTTVLLLFVLASVAYLIVDAARSGEHPSVPNAPAVTPPSGSADKVVCYYFHGTARCHTCRKIESLTHTTLQEGFAVPLKAGRLEWRTINVEEPEHAHFVQDYRLTTRSVVLVRVRNGTAAEWKNLDRVWGLVRDEAAFVNYIRNETKAFMGTG